MAKKAFGEPLHRWNPERVLVTRSSQKRHVPEIGAANLVELPLGTKFPVIPGSNTVFYTTNLSEKLYQPSYDFNLSDPYCKLLETNYKSLHDPHLKSYYRRKDILQRLKKGGYITSNNKVVCTLKELNKYRNYLTSLKLDFERNYVREQKIIGKKVNTYHETKKASNFEKLQSREWLLQENTHTKPEQELLLKNRYVDMVGKELSHKSGQLADKSISRIKEEEKRHQEHIKRKLSLRKQIEAEWKTKEMLLLKKIGEEVKRETRIEEQHTKLREMVNRKKQELLEKRLAYHLQKMQNDVKKEKPKRITFDNEHYEISEPSGTKKVNDLPRDHQSQQGQKREQHSFSFSKASARKTSISSQQNNTAEQKKGRKGSPSSYLSDKGTKSAVPVKTYTFKHVPQEGPKHEVMHAGLNKKKSRKPSVSTESAQKTTYSHQSSPKKSSRCQEKVTSEELNSIIHNTMTWVMAAVTCVLYPAITKYGEKSQNTTPPMPDASPSLSDNINCCSSHSETLPCETSQKFQAEPCAKTANRSIKQPMTPLKPASSHKEGTGVKETYKKGQLAVLEAKYNGIAEPHKHKPFIPVSPLPPLIKTETQKSKDASTEHDSGYSLSSSGKAKTISAIQEFPDICVDFKDYLKEETELILKNIFHKMVSELTQAISPLSLATLEILDDHCNTDGGSLPSSAAISSASIEIVEHMLVKLQSAIEKESIEVYSQESVTVNFESDIVVSEEYLMSSKEKILKTYTSNNINEVADSMIHMILEQLVALIASKQNELAHLKITTTPAYQQHMEEPITTFLQRASNRKFSAEPDTTNLVIKEEIEMLMSNIFSQPSLIDAIEEVISIILSYVQIGLNNEKLVATEESIIILQLLDDILTQLRQRPATTDTPEHRHRLRSRPGTKKRNSLASTETANGPQYRCLFPSINVPGMVLYSEAEEIDRITGNTLSSSTQQEKANWQEQVPDHWLTGENTDFKFKINRYLPTETAHGGKASFHQQQLNTDRSMFTNKELFEDKTYLNKETLLFSHEKHFQIEKASENIITCILSQMLKDLASGSSNHFDDKNGKKAFLTTFVKPDDLSYEEWMDRMFSVSEIHIVAQEIVDAVLKELNMMFSHVIDHASPAHETSLENIDLQNEEPFERWFDSKRKMKFVSAHDMDSIKYPWLESGERESMSEPPVHINDKIIYTVFKKLSSFICPKLQNCFKLESHTTYSNFAPDRRPLQSHLSACTTKVVNIIFDALQKELNCNKKNLNVKTIRPLNNSVDTGFGDDTEKKLDSVVIKLNNDIMTSSLAACICEVLSEDADKSSVLLPSDKLKSKASYRTTDSDQQDHLPAHSPHMHEEVHKCSGLQVLDRIGNILYDLLYKLTGDHPHSPLSDEQNQEWINENLRTVTPLQSDIQLTSHNILEDTIKKLCFAEMGHISTSSESEVFSEYIDTDSLSFNLLIKEVSRCSDIISSMASGLIQSGSQEVADSKGETTAPQTGTIQQKHPNKPKAIALDILEMVFAKLEEFTCRDLEAVSAIINGNEKGNKIYWKSGSTNTCEKLLQPMLYLQAKKVSSTILKAIQTELNVSLPDFGTYISKPRHVKQMLKNLVDVILNAVPLGNSHETELEERDIENYRYRPTYRTFLPGGADPESYLNDPIDTEKESTEEKRPAGEETKSNSFTLQELERTLTKFEVELKDPQKSPVVPMIRNILNKIFHNDLIDQLNVLPLPQSHFYDIFHAGDEPVAQTSVHSLDKTMDPLVSEADVTFVADNVVRTIFQKLYYAAMTYRKANENRYNAISFPADTSFPQQTCGRKTSVYSNIGNRNPYTLQSMFNICELTKRNIVEDIIQSVLTNLETFATSKVKALFCPCMDFTVKMALPLQWDETAISQPWLSIKDSYSDDQLSCCSMKHKNFRNTTSICQIISSKLSIYAIEVTRQILQGIKCKLDKGIKGPFLTHNVVIPEIITSQVVNTVLDIVSAKSKYEKDILYREIDSGQSDCIGKLFNKSDYRKKLQFQILDTIEAILNDICEKTLDENNLLHAASTLKCNVNWRCLKANFEMDSERINKVLPMCLVPKSCVAMISNDMVAIVLQNLSSAIILDKNGKDLSFPILPLTFSDTVLKADCQQSPVTDLVDEGERKRFSWARKDRDVPLKSTDFDDNQTTTFKKHVENSLDPHDENAYFITKTILNRLKSFVAERLDLLFTLDSQTNEKLFVGSEFTNCKQDDSLFPKFNQVPSDVNILKISTNKTIPHQEGIGYTAANCGREHESAIHIPQVCLKEYADIIASNILMLIKSDVDLEIQKMYSNPNSTSLQENIIATETINNILKRLHDKISFKTSNFYSKQDPTLFTQLAEQNETYLSQRKMGDNTELSHYPKSPDQNPVISETKNLRELFGEIFRNGGKATALLNTVKGILNKVYRKVMEDKDHWPLFQEPLHFATFSKIKTATAHTQNVQSHITVVANDIVENVFKEMFSVVMTSLLEKTEIRGELGAAGSDELLMTPPCFRGLEEAEKRCVSPECMLLQVYPYTGIRSVTSLENTLQLSPLRVGEELIQMVLQKITKFALPTLEESSVTNHHSDEMRSSSTGTSKTSPKVSPVLSFKSSFKAKSKGISLPKFETRSQPEPSGARAKNKTKLEPREKTLRDSCPKATIELPHLSSTGDANIFSLRTKLPIWKLQMYAKDIVSNILETIMTEFQKVRRERAMVSVNSLSSDQIMAASEIVNAVLQGLYTAKDNLIDTIKSPYSDLESSQKNFSTVYLENPEVHDFLETVSSQLKKIFTKDVSKQMFDKWLTESSSMENEACKLLIIAKTILNEISMKAKELEHHVSLLNLPLQTCEGRYHNFKRTASKTEASQAQINVFAQEIVEKLFEKLELGFLSQMFIKESKETLENKEETTARSKHGSLRTSNFSNRPTCNTQLKDKKMGDSCRQLAQEIMEGVLSTLESFADLQFKHISTYTFSEIVKIPVESFFALHQKPLTAKLLNLQPVTKFPGVSKSRSLMTQENIQNTLQQLHSFHSELLAYTALTVSGMLNAIKNKLHEAKQVEPPSTIVFEENLVEMDECSHFYKSVVTRHPKENLQRAENAYAINRAEFATGMRMPTLESEGVDCGDNPSQIPSLFYSKVDKIKETVSSNLPSYVFHHAGDTTKTTELESERLTLKLKPSSSRSEAQGFSCFDKAVKENSHPAGIVLQKRSQNSSGSAQAVLEAPVPFSELQSENQSVLPCKISQPVATPKQKQTTISPLTGQLAAENINTMLLSNGLPSETPHTNENVKTTTPFSVPKERSWPTKSEEQKEQNSLLQVWGKRNTYKTKGEKKSLIASEKHFTLLDKWKNKYSEFQKTPALEENEVTSFADQELGPREIHLIARFVTTSVLTHFKDFESRGTSDYDTSQYATNNINQAELYDTATKLIDSLLKEFSDAQIKVLKPSGGNMFLLSTDQISSVPKVPCRLKEPSVAKTPPEKKMTAMYKVSPVPKMVAETSTNEAFFVTEIPSTDKMLVNKIVHSSTCNILQEYRSQDSICKDINSNGGCFAKRLANAIMEEIFQHKLNLPLSVEDPASVCLPLESKEVMKRVRKITQTACKECQTSSPYTIMLPNNFLESIVSSLLSKIFSRVLNTKTEIPEDHLFLELNFFQMKLVSTIMMQIFKDKDMILQNVESLHPNDDEIVQLVAQTIYNNLLPQFGSQDSIQNCVRSGCKFLSETIGNLVVREVAGNQLQNYFSGELTPHQYIEADIVVENIPKDVTQNTEVPQPQPLQTHKLPLNIIEEIAVKLLSKLLSVFPKVSKQRNSLNSEIQKIISKILTSFQEYISRSRITVVSQTQDSGTISSADSTTIEKIIAAVYNSVLKHCGSHVTVYEDLIGKSTVLSDIIGFLMVKEISNSEFHPQAKEEASSSKLVLEAVTITEKVIEIIDDLESKKKPSDKKEAVLDAMIVEEMVALFLVKLVKLPSALNKGARDFSKPELHKITSQLTKSVAAELCRNNISVITANPEEKVLNPESMEIISQMVDSVYNQVLQQFGTHRKLYYDMKGTNHFFPKEVASLIVSKVSDCPLEMISRKYSSADLFGNLDVSQIVEKVQEHAIKMEAELEQNELDQDLNEEVPVKTIPHSGKQPIKIDPDIVAEHLAVLSIKTQPLEKLQMDCVARTGHSIEALRKASVSGRNYTTHTVPDEGTRRKERCVSLDKMGRLNVKPFETAKRNSFQNLTKPDITKVKLLKDVQGKKDPIVRLVTHDIVQEISENDIEESVTSEENEVVLQEIVRDDFPDGLLENQVNENENIKSMTSTAAKPLVSKNSLRKQRSPGKSCRCKPSVTAKYIEAPSTQRTEPTDLQTRKYIPTASKFSSERDSSSLMGRNIESVEEMKSTTEPYDYSVHRIMSSSSYNEDDLPSFTSTDENRSQDPSAKVTEDSLFYAGLNSENSIKFVTLYQRDSFVGNLSPSKDGTSDSEKPSTSKQGLDTLEKLPSLPSKMLSRSKAGVPQSPPPSVPDKL